MENSLILESHIFLTSIYGGIIAGFVYDLYRVIRYHSKPSRFITYIEDFIFWLIITYIFFQTIIKINWGEIRGYIILGFFIGVVIYIWVISKCIYPILIKFGEMIKRVTSSIIGVILYPFRKMKKGVGPGLNKIKKIPKETVKEIKKYKKIISSKK